MTDNLKEINVWQDMKVILYDWRYRVVEFETNQYPARKYPAYFASPIYQDEEWKFGMRRAWADWISSEVSSIVTDLTEDRIQEIKESIRQFLNFCRRMMKEYYLWSDEHIRFSPMVE